VTLRRVGAVTAGDRSEHGSAGAAVLPATELLEWSGEGRRFTAQRTVRLGDVDPAGELRLDAAARYLQDVASDDAVGAGLPNALGWVVRRTLLRVTAPAVAGERVELATFCTGAGRSWAERRTTLRSPGGAVIDAVSLWVQVDVTTGRPARLGQEFAAIYGPAAAGRHVSSKLTLPGRPPERAVAEPVWRFRRADLDQFGHVNNAAQLALVEERLAAGGRRGVFEIEYLGAADAESDYVVVTETDAARRLWWLVSTGGATTVTVISHSPSADAAPGAAWTM
jgi:acyl-ACP thioesterase